MALGKLVSLEISNEIVGSTLVLDECAIGFRVHRSNRFTANTAEFNISNLNDMAARDFFSTGSTVKFSVGWADQDKGELTTIFIGNITKQADVSIRGTERRFTISAVSMANIAKIRADELTKLAGEATKGITDTATKKAIKAEAQARAARLLDGSKNAHALRVNCSVSYEPGKPLYQVIEDIYGAVLGLSLDGLAAIRSITMPNGFVYTGRAYGAMARIALILKSHGYGCYVDNTNCYIYNLRDPKGALQVGYLSWDSGLTSLGMMGDYVGDDKSNEDYPPGQVIKCTSLLQPKFAPNGVVQIATDEVSGFFLIEEVEFYGDNQGGEFLCDTTLGYYGGQPVQWDAISTNTDTGMA